MKLTPLDIQQKQFRTAFRGLAAAEVEAFLDLVASEFEEVLKENIGMKDDLKRAEQRIAEMQERERALQETMVTAQRITADIKDQARKEAEIVLTEAELQAEKIVHAAHAKLVQVVEDINELKRQRVQFESQVKQVIESHLRLLEHMRAEVPSPRVDENVKFLTKRSAAGTE